MATLNTIKRVATKSAMIFQHGPFTKWQDAESYQYRTCKKCTGYLFASLEEGWYGLATEQYCLEANRKH